MIEMLLQSALERVFPDERPQAAEPLSFTVLPGETVSFQAALFGGITSGNQPVQLCAAPPFPLWTRVRWVELVPSAYPCNPATDDNYQRRAPGMFPDVLWEPKDGLGRVVAGQWRSAWIDIEVPDNAVRGMHPLTLQLKNQAGEILSEKLVTVHVLGAALPAQTLMHTEWFHADCLADYYAVAPRSEKWWAIVEKFVSCAAKRGINMLLTPVFTPPLDTVVGGERTTVQLVDISYEKGTYRFDFDGLDTWVALCLQRGIRYFEIPHLFTQWGAKCAPKIIVSEDGCPVKRFGWHTSALAEEYRLFLSQFIPALRAALRRLGVEERTVFHISDEPAVEHLEAYAAAANMVRPLLEGCRIMDAMSSFALYQQGAVQNPIVATDHIKPFLEHGVQDLWAYYCIAQDRCVSNRFFSMPLARCRILGVQLYKFAITGFLHWGFNFYNSGLSRKHIDPFCVTDADCSLPSGDPFIVYPGQDGAPMESVRLMAMHAAMQDMRLLGLLEQLTSRDYVLALIDEGLPQPVAFDVYPRHGAYLIQLFDKVRHEINKRV